MVPKEGSLVPVGGSLAPPGVKATPGRGSLVPVRVTLAPSRVALVPGGTWLVPAGSSLVPVVVAVVPMLVDDVPGGGSLVPVRVALAPSSVARRSLGVRLVPRAGSLTTRALGLMPSGARFVPTGAWELRRRAMHGLTAGKEVHSPTRQSEATSPSIDRIVRSLLGDRCALLARIAQASANVRATTAGPEPSSSRLGGRRAKPDALRRSGSCSRGAQPLPSSSPRERDQERGEERRGAVVGEKLQLPVGAWTIAPAPSFDPLGPPVRGASTDAQRRHDRGDGQGRARGLRGDRSGGRLEVHHVELGGRVTR